MKFLAKYSIHFKRFWQVLRLSQKAPLRRCRSGAFYGCVVGRGAMPGALHGLADILRRVNDDAVLGHGEVQMGAHAALGGSGAAHQADDIPRRHLLALRYRRLGLQAARISGCNTGKLVFRHLIPNILPQFLVYVSTGVASSIIMVSSFAFLGLGLPSGTPEWGAMLNDARTALYSHPELLIYPGLCIFVTAAGFNLFGEALRDILTPEEDSL